MLLKALTEAVRLLYAALVFTALLLASTCFLRFAGGFGLRILGANITSSLFFYNISAMRILNLLATVIGVLFSAMGVYRLAYMKSGLRQRLVFFRKGLSYFIYLSLMLGLVLPYLTTWVCSLWSITKGYLTLVVF